MSRQALSTRGSAAVRGSAAAATHAGRTGMTLARKCDCGNHAAGGTCDACAEKKKRKVARFADRAVQGGDNAPPIVHDVLHSGGDRLSDSVRAMMEPRFGTDFSDVRLHTDETAAQSARAVSAHAYTAGSHIAFASGRYQPSTADGQRLIAHELTHVVQQRGSESGGAAGGSATSNLTIGHPADASEHEADATADRVLRARPSGQIDARGSGVQRDLSGGAIGGIVAGAVAGAAGIGALIAWAAGGFDKETFTTDELIAYLDELAATGAPKKKTISDNMARDVVRHWLSGKDDKIDVSKGHQGKQKSLTSIELKRLLIQEMLAGPTTGADEEQIIAIITNSTDREIVEVFNPDKGLTIQDVNKDVGGDQNAALMALLEEKFPRESKVRSQVPADSACNARDTLTIAYARVRGVQAVEHTIQMLATPEDEGVKRALDCYFRGAKPSDVATILDVFTRIRDHLTTAKYACVRGMATGVFNVPSEKTLYAQCVEEDADALKISPELEKSDPRIEQGARQVFLCDKFFARDFETQAATIIHENAHRVGIDDLQYHPKCGYALTDALVNSDSYADFAMALFAQRGAASQPSPVPATAPASKPASQPADGGSQGKQ